MCGGLIPRPQESQSRGDASHLETIEGACVQRTPGVNQETGDISTKTKRWGDGGRDAAGQGGEHVPPLALILWKRKRRGREKEMSEGQENL